MITDEKMKDDSGTGLGDGRKNLRVSFASTCQDMDQPTLKVLK
jgi:hypothetical protein